ncbi:MAG: transglutaminaseTgpA domain-containing protein, partial [Chloroflexota bacterium]
LVFTMMVAGLFWFLGYNSAWHIFRFDRVFRVILPPGLVLISNTAFYSGEANLAPYIAIYMFLALLLVVRSYFNDREWEWYTHGIRVPQKVRRQFNVVGTSLALVAVLIGWGIPTNDIQTRLDAFQQFMQSQPLAQMSELWNRLFSSVEAYGPVTADYYGGDTLELSGAIQLGNQVVMEVEVPAGRRYYWRSRVFDTYESGNWTSQALERVPVVEAPFEIGQDGDTLRSREPVQQQFTLGLNASRLVYAAPQPFVIDVPVRSDLRYLDAERTTANVHVIRPFRVLERGDSYSATSLMTRATADELRNAGENYPQWVRDTQLYVSPSVPGRVLALGDQIIRESGAVTPYDKAKAIERWLRANIIYDENIPQPPSGQDPVDWVLFDHGRGYCNYYASAMIIMLRHQGIPARMGAGFAQGEFVDGRYVVRERDAHTWVEAYLPGYGWIEFEPTAAQAPLDRGDNENPVIPTETPAATSTPTATPTQTPTPTATLSPTPDPSQPPPTDPPQEDAFSPATPTPTMTPTLTATPIIVPTSQPPLSQQPSGPLAFILPALITALVGLLVLAVVVAIAVFIWWWWEWRGMRGLSPVVRAYARMERYTRGLLGLRIPENKTTLERRGDFLDKLPKKAYRPVTAITNMYTEERYGRGPGNDVEVQQHATSADKAWKRTREHILSDYLWRFVPFARFFRRDE